MLTREEHTEKIRQIRELVGDNDENGSITEILADLSDDYGSTLSEIEQKDLKVTKLQNENENLRDTNMRLFLKVGEKVNKQEEKEIEENNEDETNNIKIDDLFDEKGELKNG